LVSNTFIAEAAAGDRLAERALAGLVHSAVRAHAITPDIVERYAPEAMEAVFGN